MAFSSYGSSTISLLNVANQTTTMVADGDEAILSPGGVVFSADGALLYIANYGLGNIVVVDVAAAAIIDTLEGAALTGVWTIGLSGDGSTLVLSVFAGGYVLVNRGDETDVTVIENRNARYVHSQFPSVDGSMMYFVGQNGDVDVVSLADREVNDGWVSDQEGNFYSACANSEKSVMYLVSEGTIHAVLLGGPRAGTALVAPVTGDPHADYFSCLVSPDDGTVFVTDAHSAGPGIIGQFDASTLRLVATQFIEGLSFPAVVGLAGCNAYVAGYLGGIGVLRDFACAAPAAPTPPTPPTSPGSPVPPSEPTPLTRPAPDSALTATGDAELAATGSADPIAPTGFAGLALLAGIALLIPRRRSSTV